jgi:hypothetical protein
VCASFIWASPENVRFPYAETSVTVCRLSFSWCCWARFQSAIPSSVPAIAGSLERLQISPFTYFRALASSWSIGPGPPIAAGSITLSLKGVGVGLTSCDRADGQTQRTSAKAPRTEGEFISLHPSTSPTDKLGEIKTPVEKRTG